MAGSVGQGGEMIVGVWPSLTNSQSAFRAYNNPKIVR